MYMDNWCFNAPSDPCVHDAPLTARYKVALASKQIHNGSSDPQTVQPNDFFCKRISYGFCDILFPVPFMCCCPPSSQPERRLATQKCYSFPAFLTMLNHFWV